MTVIHTGNVALARLSAKSGRGKKAPIEEIEKKEEEKSFAEGIQEVGQSCSEEWADVEAELLKITMRQFIVGRKAAE